MLTPLTLVPTVRLILAALCVTIILAFFYFFHATFLSWNALFLFLTAIQILSQSSFQDEDAFWQSLLDRACDTLFFCLLICFSAGLNHAASFLFVVLELRSQIV